MSPDEEAQHADRKNGEHHRAITEDRLARESRKNVRRSPHARQNRDINLRMAKEPEKVLPQQWRAAVMQGHGGAADIQPPGNEEARAGNAIEQQENAAAQKNRE